ncbi:MAG: hypothetical protein ACTHK8_18910 [Ginsengibacter sp.]
MIFFYDRISGQSGLDQYKTYIENEIYIRELRNDTKDILNYQLIETRRAIGRNTDVLKRSINDTINAVCGSLENGFNQITNELEGINWRINESNEALSDLHSLLDWKTDLLIEELKITNFYLGNIEILLKIPESQKQRSYHVENGMIYLKNAIEEEISFYDVFQPPFNWTFFSKQLVCFCV